MSDNPVLSEFRDLFRGVDHKEVHEAMHYVESCYDPNTPPHEISRIGVTTTVLNLHHHFPDRNTFFEKAEQLVKIVTEHLKSLGYRDDICTYQEHTLLGSTQWSGYAKEPHKPIGIIKGEFSVQEGNKARLLARKWSGFGRYFQIKNDLIPISLELLDSDGNTVRDPRVLDDKLNSLATKYSPDFPFRRVHLN